MKQSHPQKKGIKKQTNKTVNSLCLSNVGMQPPPDTERHVPEVALSKWRDERVEVREARLRMSMQPVGTKLWWWAGPGRVGSGGVGLTLPVGRMPRVDVERLLALADGGGQRQVGLHHPLLVVAVDDGLGRHGQRVALGHVLGQRGERLLGLQEEEAGRVSRRERKREATQPVQFSFLLCPASRPADAGAKKEVKKKFYD